MAMTLISTNTADDDSSLAITSGIDSTYKLYIFKFLNVHCAVDTADLRFQVNATDNTGYNDSAITTSAFQAKHAEDDGTASLAYDADFDEAQTTGDADIQKYLGSGSDESMSGEIFLFNPSNTTYVKHFYGTFNALYALLCIKVHKSA